MENAFLTWVRDYVAHIEQELHCLESRCITLGQVREGVWVDTTPDVIDKLKRHKGELLDLIPSDAFRSV